MLIWDGLQVHIPDTMEPTVLDRGFIRLTGVGVPMIDLRFGPRKIPFDPKRDGLRIQQKAGLTPETLHRCRTPWARRLPGVLYTSSRLSILHFEESQGIVAALFSAPPPPALVESFFPPLKWSPQGGWRRWCCFDLTFLTPPDFALVRAEFRPGRFHQSFVKGQNKLSFDRLAPANVLLANGTLKDWCEHHLHTNFYKKTAILRWSDTEVDFERPPPLLSQVLPWLPGFAQPLKGKIRHLLEDNKLLIITEHGPAMGHATSSRINDSYAIIPAIKT